MLCYDWWQSDHLWALKLHDVFNLKNTGLPGQCLKANRREMCIQSKKKYSEKKNQETANQNKVAWQWLHKIHSCYLGILCILQYLKLVSETTTAAGWIHCRCDTFHSSKEIAYLEQLGILLSIFIPQQV